MKTILNWKKGLFKTIYEIYSESNLVGYLNEKSLTESSHGELYGEKYYFKVKGLLNQETRVFKNENNTPIGKINYNSWMTRARIEYSGKVYYWKYDNTWNKDWRLYNAEGLQVKYNSSSSKGSIEYELQDNFLVLTGLYINNFYWKTALILLIAVFLPVFMVIFN